MKIELQHHPELLRGVDHLERRPEGWAIHRFSADLIRGSEIRQYMYRCSAGCRIAGVTDARSIRLDFLIPPPFYSCYEARIDVTVAGEAEERSFLLPPTEPGTPPRPLTVEFPLPGRGEGSRFEVWLPVQCEAVWVAGEAVDASFLCPLPATDGILFLGDSITQGYFGAPAGIWAARIARRCGRDFFDLGIGGAQLAADCAASAADFRWREAVIAYGVNDCSAKRDLAEFRQALRELWENLIAEPEQRILVVTPLPWLAGIQAGRRDELARYRRALAETAAELHGVSVIDGESLLPESQEFFEDGCHPNGEGMRRIADALLPWFSAL